MSDLSDYLIGQARHEAGEFTYSRRDDGHKHCDWCGSITPEDAVTMLTTPGTKLSGSDWKYGFPHKFYLGDRSRFYTVHLRGASEETFAAFAKTALPLLGIEFTRDDGRVACRVRPDALAPGIAASRRNGWQSYGVVPESEAPPPTAPEEGT